MADPPPPTRVEARRPTRPLMLIVVYIALAVVRLLPLSLHPGTRLADEGDAVLAAWVSWWGTQHLSLGWPGVLHANAFYPHPAGLLYADPLLAQAALAWPLFHLLRPVPALNLLTVATLALCAVGFHLYAREWGADDPAATVGAVLFAFNSFMLANLPRIAILSLGWLPLALLSLHRLFTRGEPRWAVPLALFSVLHGLSCLYYLTFYAIVLAVLVPVYVWAARAWRRPAVLAAFAGGVGAAALGIAPLAIQMRSVFRAYGFFGEIKPFDLILYLTPPRGDALYGALGDALRPPGFYVDYFLGFVSCAVAGVGLVAAVRQRRPDRPLWLAWLVVGTVSLALSAGPDMHWAGHPLGRGPYALLRGLEGFSRLREPRRLGVLVLLVSSLLATRGAGLAFGRISSPRTRRAAAVALATVVLLEHWSALQAQGVAIPVADEIPPVYRWVAARPGAEPLIDLPPRPASLQRFMAFDQYFSTVHGKPIVTGWPSFFPPALETILWELRDFPDARSIALLRALDIRLAVVHPKRWEAERPYYEKRLAAREDVLPTLARFPERALASWERYGLGGEEVHAIAPAAEPPAPRACACREVSRLHYGVRASGGTAAEAAVDGRADTSWTTSSPQEDGAWFEVALDRPRRLSRIEIEMAFPYGNFARNLEVTGARDGEEWPMGPLPDIGYDVWLVRQLIRDPSAARLRYDLRPAVVDRLRLRIWRTEDGAAPWNIPEIHVFESPEGTDSGG